MSNETGTKPVDLSRRRLAKSGLAAPIVLATLASKNALASPAYRCTISGQLSGNTSAPRDPNASCDLGPSVADLRADSGWGDVNKDAEFRTIFTDVYWKGTGGNLRSTPVPPPTPPVPGTTPIPATFNDVMTIDGVNTSHPPLHMTLGRVAIAAYVGYIAKGADYPLSLDQIKGMFDYAFRGVDYPFPGPSETPTKANLNRQEVVSYFTFLTGGAEPIIIP